MEENKSEISDVLTYKNIEVRISIMRTYTIDLRQHWKSNESTVMSICGGCVNIF